MVGLSAHTLFHLLRSALGTQSAEMIPADTDWRKVIDLSFEQGVAAIAVDGLQKSLELMAYSLEKVGAESLEWALDSPELEDLKYEWFGATFQAEEDYDRNNKAVLKLREESLELRGGFVVLKGLAIARKYPVPEHRASVDLDIFGLRGESLELRA